MTNVFKLFQNMYPESFPELFTRIIVEISKRDKDLVYDTNNIDSSNSREEQLNALDRLVKRDEEGKKFDVVKLVELVSDYNRKSIFRSILIATLNHEGFNVNFVLDPNALRRIYDTFNRDSLVYVEDAKNNIVIIAHYVSAPKTAMTEGFNLRRRITDKLWIEDVYVWDSIKVTDEHLKEFLDKLHTIRWNAI